jgi:acyl-CoA thioester hydrolase
LNHQVFTKKLSVQASAIDARNHVNNLSYLQWCLEAAEAHWEQSASKELKEEYIWYVLQHTIDYKNAAFEGDDLQIETWVTLAEGIKSERCYKITRLKDKKVLVEAKTLWCLLNARTQKPKKITEEIRNLFL